MGKKPLIGITGYHVRGEEGYGGSFRGLPGQGFSIVGHDYIRAVERTGGVAVGVPVGRQKDCRTILEGLDGLVLSGGEDIDPSLYGERPDMRCWQLTPERDWFELALIEEAIHLRKPVLAICRGMQLFNIHFGGTLYKDVADVRVETLTHQFNRAPRWYLAHRVKLLHPILTDLYGKAEIDTNSYHHQVIKEPGEGLFVSATAEDGVVEGLYHPDHPNILAVQWHPETMAVEYEEGLLPFRWLIEQVKGEGGKKDEK
ncbi:gamma-glutamyl-gamma-aminobutyrate hydrolase family protein [Melghirimyces algeriensis]|uniref:Putative glutamine amidotransferase n=1 Tax=Melghirimyces algeriensis TaxID=910412 RepID=A0A521CF18_9BACL|nr:gamma-glutamyl-gamma-aminobutyrate hydrolase family protein [Melghirimyces algeriensis]SMO57975.1 putative glutamine amidotransferase [Melghirimyces algeriensis]